MDASRASLVARGLRADGAPVYALVRPPQLAVSFICRCEPMSPVGPTRTSGDVRLRAAAEGIADIRNDLTSGHRA
jgi:hypothetical protein